MTRGAEQRAVKHVGDLQSEKLRKRVVGSLK